MSDRAFPIAIGLSLALHGILTIALSGPRFATPIVPPPAQAPSVRVRLAGPPQVEVASETRPPTVAAAPPRLERTERIEKKIEPERPQPEPEPVLEASPPDPDIRPLESTPTETLAAVDPEASSSTARPADGVPDTSGSADLPSTRPSSEDESNRLARYVEAVRERIEARKRYPSMARKRAVEGRVVARVAIRADGRVSAVEFDGGAPALLRRATDDAIREAAPYPAPPAGALTIELPVDYSLRDAS
jgi:protein TonB